MNESVIVERRTRCGVLQHRQQAGSCGIGNEIVGSDLFRTPLAPAGADLVLHAGAEVDHAVEQGGFCGKAGESGAAAHVMRLGQAGMGELLLSQSLNMPWRPAQGVVRCFRERYDILGRFVVVIVAGQESVQHEPPSLFDGLGNLRQGRERDRVGVELNDEVGLCVVGNGLQSLPAAADR